MSALHAGLQELSRVHLERVEAARLALVEAQLRSCPAMDPMLLDPLREQLRERPAPQLHEPMLQLAEQLTWRLHRGLLGRLGQELSACRRLAITWQVCTGQEGFLAEVEALASALDEQAAGSPDRACTRLMARLGLLEACDQLLDPGPDPAARFQAAMAAADRRLALERHSREHFAPALALLQREPR